MSASQIASATKDDVWVQTVCDYCNGNCGVRVHRVDGVVVKVEGDPDCPVGAGKICAKGQAAFMTVYDPDRVLYPMKRTNPKKGFGVDPQWKRITWEEALDTIADKLKKIRADDPRKLLFHTWDVNSMEVISGPWASSFGAGRGGGHVGPTCGSGVHPITYIINGSFQQEVDVPLCNYLILAGAQYGFAAGVSANLTTQKVADARVRGMKVVVIDPIGTNAAAKADLWVPIRPGTDAAMFLAMANVILNELGIWDAAFIKDHTNGPYLIGQDGNYVRDGDSQKPLMWDKSANAARPFDAGIADPALEGTYEVDGEQCRPAFQVLKDHVKQYTPEGVASLTTVPADVTRQVAREFAEAARVGSTIVVEGQELPYRPAAVKPFKGLIGHTHAWLNGQAAVLLNLIVGSYYVPGGYRGVNMVGPFGWWGPLAEKDGMLVSHPQVSMRENYYERRASPPETLSYAELMPFASGGNPYVTHQNIKGEGYAGRKSPVRPEMLIRCRSNFMAGGINLQEMSELADQIPFIVSLCQEMDETTEWSDILLPDTHQLERLRAFPHRPRISMTAAAGQYFWGFQVPALPPAGEARDWAEVLIDLADRVGFLPELNMAVNVILNLKEPYTLKVREKARWEDLCDRMAKSTLGADKGLDHFKKNGYTKVKKNVQQEYPSHFMKARVPLYAEIIKRRGDELRAVVDELGIPWDTSDYVPLPVWKPCPAHDTRSEEFDLIPVNYKIPLHFQSVTSKNPLLDEVSQRHPYAYALLINSQTAQKKGIKDGDMIWVESTVGKVKGRAKVSECVHPEVVGIAGRLGSWAQHPIAKGKGVNYNALLDISDAKVDKITGAVDSCQNVKIYKA